MKVTEHFSVSEFACKDGSSYPVEWIETRLHTLCEVLELVRAEFGAAIRISSGYRTSAYNTKIGGALNSKHVRGEAADIVVVGVGVETVQARIHALYRLGRLPKLGGLGKYSTFTHVDVRPRVGDRLSTWFGARKEN